MRARQMVSLLRRWLPTVPIKLIGDTASSILELGLHCVAQHVTLIAPFRLDSVIHQPAEARTRHTIGRPRVVGKRLPSLESVFHDPKTVWQRITVDWYGEGKRALEICIERINILDETEGEYAYRAQPYTFVLRPDLRIHAIYNGWYFVGRPTNEELRHDLRAIMQTRSDYHYEASTTPEVQQIRIPQQEWVDGAPPLGANGLSVAQGVVRWFDLNAGIGMIARAGSGADVFFHFTALPGQGYRTIRPGIAVQFEVVETRTGPTARNIQQIKEPIL